MAAKKVEDRLLQSITGSSTYGHFFELFATAQQAKCKICSVVLMYDQRKHGTNSLKRHLQNKHPKCAVAKAKYASTMQCSSSSQPIITAFDTRSTKYSSIRKCVITLATSRHVLPLNFFEDPAVSTGFDVPVISTQQVHCQLREIAEELRLEVLENHRGLWASLALDGWTNTATSQKHLSFIMFLSSKPTVPFFVRSFVIPDNTAATITDCTQQVILMLSDYDITVTSMITDNARRMTAAAEKVFADHPTVLPLPCAAHILNLVIKDAFRDVEFIKNGLEILNDYINKKIVRRYCITRWNSVYDRLKDVAKHSCTTENEEREKLLCINNIVNALEPFIDVLNSAQSDEADWMSVYSSYCSAIQTTRLKGFDSLVTVAENRRHMLLNEVVALLLYVEKHQNLDLQKEQRIKRWLSALNVPEFEKYVADREFHGVNATVPRRLRLFIDHKIKGVAVSEAAVERCFSVHKLVHSSLRASLTDEIVNDILFIRYNIKFVHQHIVQHELTDEEEQQLECVPKFDD